MNPPTPPSPISVSSDPEMPRDGFQRLDEPFADNKSSMKSESYEMSPSDAVQEEEKQSRPKHGSTDLR